MDVAQGNEGGNYEKKAISTKVNIWKPKPRSAPPTALTNGSVTPAVTNPARLAKKSAGKAPAVHVRVYQG